MTDPQTDPTAPAIGALPVGTTPWVVGTVTEEATLRRLAEGERVACDIVEVRLDQVGSDLRDWPVLCRQVGERVAPVLFTLRHAREGGAWEGPERERQALLREALPAVHAVDTEVEQGGLAETVQGRGRGNALVIGSFHDFHGTPSAQDLDDVVRRGIDQGADIVKLACLIRNSEDEARLLALLERHTGAPLCVLGMGPLGAATRVRFPCRGSCLTYGYLDRPAAPGQVQAGTLRAQLAAACPAYAETLRG